MKHITQIIFFDDYALWMMVRKESRKKGHKKPLDFIAEIIEQKTGQNNLDTDDDLYIACETEAKRHKMPIAAFIEDSCREALGLQAKAKWYELPRA